MDLHRPILCRSVGTESYSICMEFRQCPRILDLHRPILGIKVSVGTASAWTSGNVPEFQSWTCRHKRPIFCKPWVQNPAVPAWNSGNVPEFQLGLTGRCSQFQFQSSSFSVSQCRFSRITSTWLRCTIGGQTSHC